jgi:PAS domain S-box-containing protein
VILSVKLFQKWYDYIGKGMRLNHKLLIATFIMGIIMWGFLDYFMSFDLEAIFEKELKEKLEKQAQLNRIHFDWFVRAHHQAANVFLSQKNFVEYVEKANWSEDDNFEVKYHHSIPQWLPSASVLRSMIHIRYVILLDNKNKVREIYQDWPAPLPRMFYKPTWLLHLLSHHRTFMTTIENKPFLITAESLENAQGKILALLMIVNPIDDHFLIESQYDQGIYDSIIALMTGNEPKVLASADPGTIPYNIGLEELEKHFLVTGKSFFDYGTSDLLLQLMTFISKESFKAATESILYTTRIHRAITALGIIMFSLSIGFIITKKIKQITINVSEFSKKFGIKPLVIDNGDELYILKEQYQHLQRELIQSRDDLKKKTETQRKLFQAVEQSPTSIIITDYTGTIEYVNPKCTKATGYRSEDVIGKKLNIFTSNVNYPAFHNIMEETIKSGKQWKGEIKNRTENGEIYWESVIISPVKNETENITHFIAVKEDISERKRAEELLRFQVQLLDSVREAVVATDLKGNIIYWGRGAEALYGYKDEEVLNKPVLCIIGISRTEKKEENHTFSGNVWSGEYLQRHKDGTVFWADTDASPVLDNNGYPCGMIGITRDITERKQMEKELRKRKNMLDEAQHIARLGDWQWNIVTNKLLWSEEIYRIFGLEASSFNNTFEAFLKAVHSDDQYDVEMAVCKSLYKNEPYNITHRIVLPDRTERVVQEKGKVIFNIRGEPIEMIGTIHDITDLKRAEEELKKHKNQLEEMVEERTYELREKEVRLVASLKEKEILLQEIHHRVKNNMQVISSLFGLQMASIKDLATIEIFKESLNRIRTMALVHEKLYRSEELAHINFSDYVASLIGNLLSSFGINEREVSLKMNVMDIDLGVDTAIPCGLIINELVSNALKHAFPDSHQGEIHLSLLKINESEIELVVKDNGVGIPHEIDFLDTGSLGLHIVTTLVRQLNGQIDLKRTSGTEFMIRFSINILSNNSRYQKASL